MAITMAENPRWIGSQGLLDVYVDPDAFVAVKSGVSTHPGGKPVMICLKNNHKRSGPNAVPFPGQAAIYFGPQDRIVWVHLLPIDGFFCPHFLPI